MYQRWLNNYNKWTTLMQDIKNRGMGWGGVWRGLAYLLNFL